VLDDLRALVEFAQAGSIVGAADRLFRTPSAVTRQVQRLEAALGSELLDRSVKPPRLNSLGSRVLEQARDLLQRTEALKSLTSSDAEPQGLLRIGLSHALAEGSLIDFHAPPPLELDGCTPEPPAPVTGGGLCEHALATSAIATNVSFLIRAPTQSDTRASGTDPRPARS